ncbi:MAG: 4Fe-4S binding protein [Treponema sp.]|nr:4Fe-4S binding protein [Treponema sp.]
MKQLLILSGKGGTGKTTIAGAFIKLSETKSYADCDVDAPNLHLVTNWNIEPKKTDYYGLHKAVINQHICIHCDQCRKNCRFDAISIDNGYKINLYACEGCSVCEYVCPVNAIKMKPNIDGELNLYNDDNKKVFSTAQLKMGSGTSGLLVTEVKKQLKTVTVDTKFSIIDGSPGIGCPVIASLNGVDMVLIVAEPTISGINDMERIINTSVKFGIRIAVCINKYDINKNNSYKIKEYCQKNNIKFVGEIPFDSLAVKAINSGQTIVDIKCPAGIKVKEIYEQTIKYFFE